MNLVLFFTYKMSLRGWYKRGLLEREVALYRRLQPHLGQICFLTYGDKRDLDYEANLGGIQVLCNRWRLPVRYYARLAPFLYWRQMRQADLFKTNQTEGAIVALRAKRMFGKPMIARCGYMWSLHAGRDHGFQSPEAQRARREEQVVFSGADHVVVTAPEMRDYIAESYAVPKAKVTVIPNYVDTGLFKPQSRISSNGATVCFVGRLIPRKNAQGLLEAIKGLAVKLLIVGDGPQREELEAIVKRDNLDVSFVGRVPHEQLPIYLNQCDIYVLPSAYEGHPKTLIEAMACGVPVIGADSPGIREIIQHSENGYLCATDPVAIRDAICSLLDNPSLRITLGRNGRDYVEKHYALDRIQEMELTLYRSLVSAEKKG